LAGSKFKDIIRITMSTVLVLNAGYEPLHKVSINHAIKMLVRQVAVIEEATEEMFGDFPKPLVLRLVKYISMKWRNHKPKWSKNRLFKRDNDSCGYCDKPATTVDHVIPRSRGGETTWKNTVASCLRCNSKKGSRTLKESNMSLRFQPFEPTWIEVYY
jgi:5-methylcytosine-specific restriction endonuclease McrA